LLPPKHINLMGTVIFTRQTLCPQVVDVGAGCQS
jgi:hypothetical protein